MTLMLGNTIVNTYMLPIITYTTLVWGYLTTMDRKVLQNVLNRGLKLAA